MWPSKHINFERMKIFWEEYYLKHTEVDPEFQIISNGETSSTLSIPALKFIQPLSSDHQIVTAIVRKLKQIRAFRLILYAAKLAEAKYCN